MNLNLLLLKLSIQKNEILLWESFADIYLRALLTLIAIKENISKEQESFSFLKILKLIYLMILSITRKTRFLDSLPSNLLIPLFLQATKITCNSNSLIDDVFSNVIYPEVISINLTATLFWSSASIFNNS